MRSPLSLRHLAGCWAVIAVAALVLLTGNRGMAQDEVPEPEPTVIAPLADLSLVLAGARAGGRLVVVGARGHILLSDDNGGQWRQVPAPTQAQLTGVAFATPEVGWAVGHDAAILKTADAGETWTIQHWAPDWQQPLMDIVAIDADTAIAVGAYGLYMETEDGGATWIDRYVTEDDFHFNAIEPLPDGGFMMAGEFGGIYRTLPEPGPDGLLEWEALVSPYAGSFFGAQVVDQTTWLVYGIQGNLFRTEDGGEIWQSVPTGTTAGLTAGAINPSGAVVVVGLGGTVLTSTDAGASFDLTQRRNREALAGLVFAANGTLVLLGEAGAIAVEPASVAN